MNTRDARRVAGHKQLALVRCQRKRRFDSEGAAREFVAAMGNGHAPYWCWTCGGWHLTGGQKARRTADVNAAGLYIKPGIAKRLRRARKKPRPRRTWQAESEAGR